MKARHVHLVGVCGTGMGALAGLLRSQGHRVTGSDRAFHAPMGPKLLEWGVETREGYRPENLRPAPDLVVVGNVCRSDNPEARAAVDAGLPYSSMAGVLRDEFLQQRPSLVIAGTHGKTTTTALTAYLLDATGQRPGYLLGGVPGNFSESFALGDRQAPFVIEGDEYDTAYFEKTPKFWHYAADAAVLTAVEHDHIDIYPDPASYRAAFEHFVARLPPDGLLVAYAGDPEVRAIARRASCPVCYYALAGDPVGEVEPDWLGKLGALGGERQGLDVQVDGANRGRLESPLSGAHNARNLLASLAICHLQVGVPLPRLLSSVPGFRGVRRRQELRGQRSGLRVYDDFAHHPTAVGETLAGLRARHPAGQLIAVYEPRSATASRRLHQSRYPAAFDVADLVLLAPVGRPEIVAEERLDVVQLAADINRAGAQADRARSFDEHGALRDFLRTRARPGDTVVIMSNGHFDGMVEQVVQSLGLDPEPAVSP